MNDQAIQTNEEVANAYLLQLQDLAHEISRAMESIATNALTRFQESVARQEMLCAVMAGMRSRHFADARIDEARTTIRQLNLQYAALLRHSGRTIGLLASLYRSHTGQFQEARGPRLKRQTWSCEM